MFRENPTTSLATQEDVVRLEQIAGHELPQDYRSYLMTSSGALPIRTDFWLQHPDGPWIESFCDMDNVEELFRSWELQRLNIDSGVKDYPDCLWPIGGNGCGDYFMISFRPDSAGRIFQRCHEWAGGDPEEMEGFYEIGPSFSEWIASLQIIAEK